MNNTTDEITAEEIMRLKMDVLEDMIKNDSNIDNAIKEAAKKWKKSFDYIDSLIPYIEEVCKKEDITPEVILNSITISGEVLDVDHKEQIEDILKSARKLQRAALALQIQKKQTENLQPSQVITYNKNSHVKTTTTKLYKRFYSAEPLAKEQNGTMCLRLGYGTKENIPLNCKFSFNDSLQGEQRKFTAFDYFVGMICNNLFLEGNTVVTPSKILSELGYKKVYPNDIKKLMDSLNKGMLTTIEIDNKKVLESYGKPIEKYKRIKTPVLPIQIVQEVSKIRGNITDTLIYINSLSPFYLVGEPLTELTTWDKCLFKLYKHNKTERYWRIMQYLTQEIAWMRNNRKRRRVITYEAVYKACNDQSRKEKKRTEEVLGDILSEVFEPLEIISDVKKDPKEGKIKFKCPLAKDEKTQKTLAENRDIH